MFTALLLLSLSQSSHACESAAVERPGLSMPAPEWGFVVRPETACEPSNVSAAELYRLGVDPAAQDSSEERDDLNIYVTEEP